MACDDPRYQESMADAALGRLSPGERFQVRSHLRQCTTCRELLLVGATLAGRNVEDLLSDNAHHLSETELNDYYLGALDGNPRRLSEIAGHLETCAECRAEFELLVDIERQLELVAQRERRPGAVPTSPRRTWQRILWNPALACALLLVVVVPVVWLLRSNPAETPSAGVKIPQAIELLETTRSSGNIQTVYRSSADGYLHLRFPIPHRVQTHSYRITSTTAASVKYWLNFADAGTIDALVNLGSVADGRLTLIVEETDAQNPADVIPIPFTIQLETISK